MAEEFIDLNRMVSMCRDSANNEAAKEIAMYIKDWRKKLGAFLQVNEEEILNDTGKITHKVALAIAETEFRKYSSVPNKLLESDFDVAIIKLSD